MENLEGYIRREVEGGAKRADVQEKLVAVGWPEDEVDEAYARALKSIGVPVPEKSEAFGKKASTLEIVLNFFSFILLGILVGALGTLYFEIIDKYFPGLNANAVYGSRVSASSVYYSIAALIIAFPLYFFAVRMWFRTFREEGGRRESRLTKWITYLVLLVASVSIVWDLIAILSTFLQGELTVRFFLQAFTILAIAGLVFSFYFLERRRVQYRQGVSGKTFQQFGWGLLVLIILGIVFGFLAVGPPEAQRARTFDQERAGDLTTLASCIDQYARTYKRLPESLESFTQAENSFCANLRDPETGDTYEYTVITPSRTVGTNREGEYELCATFTLVSEDRIFEPDSRMYDGTPNKWAQHGSGRECDRQTAVLEDLNDGK